MFPNTITIYHHSISNSADAYTKTVLHGFYVYSTEGISKAGRGEQDADTFVAVSSPIMARSFGDAWSCENNDRIVEGEGDDITSWKDIPEAKVIASIKRSVIGSSVDNITIKAR